MHKITKNVHEVTHEALTGQVIEQRHALCIQFQPGQLKIRKKFIQYYTLKELNYVGLLN